LWIAQPSFASVRTSFYQRLIELLEAERFESFVRAMREVYGQVPGAVLPGDLLWALADRTMSGADATRCAQSTIFLLFRCVRVPIRHA